MKESEEPVEELAYSLIQALDEWSECLQQVLEGAGCLRSGLVVRLRDVTPRIDNPLLGYWLLGRDQLLGEQKASRRVPTVQDTARILEAFRDDGAPQRQRLMNIAARIEFQRTRLYRARGHYWRSAVINTLRAAEQPSSPSPA